MKKVATLFTLLLLLTGMGMAQNPEVDELLKSGRSLIDKNDALALKKFEAVLEIDGKHYEALHESSLLYSRIGNRFDSKDEMTRYFRKAKDLAQQAIDVNGQDPEGYFVMGVALGRISLIAGTKEKVSNVRDIKKNAELALKYNNKHAGAWHLLGRVHTGVANASKAERIAANTLFGGLPKDCSNERAVFCYEQAISYRPGYLLYHYDLAEVYYFAEQYSECESTLKKLLSMKNGTEDDPGIKVSAKEMLSQFQ